jgi:hypothetical protein
VPLGWSIIGHGVIMSARANGVAPTAKAAIIDRAKATRRRVSIGPLYHAKPLGEALTRRNVIATYDRG